MYDKHMHLNSKIFHCILRGSLYACWFKFIFRARSGQQYKDILGPFVGVVIFCSEKALNMIMLEHYCWVCWVVKQIDVYSLDGISCQRVCFPCSFFM